MANKKSAAPKQTGRIIERSLEEVMHTSMMPYAEYVILERALPRVEDGLKPVQRRILYSMMELGITPDKPHRKCARIVGDCLGKYHPHGDSSVYGALVRMAQDFNMSVPLVDGHGNFGSVDGDPAAAMRYTEARLTPAALELLRDIEKETVPFTLNFDDSEKEPEMLPGRFPNLIVNGAYGIAVGLSTSIPPHNMGEAIDGVIALLKKPRLDLDGLMEHIKGPDFPTGGYCTTGDGLRQAYETGKGSVQLRAKTEIERDKNGRSRIVITQLPYQVEKAGLLSKVLKLCEERKGILQGISDIRDESDKTGMRAVIEIRRDGDAEKILNYLFRYSDLQVNFHFNMVAIVDGKPKQLGLLEMCQHYVDYQKDILLKRSMYELFEAERREHILSGLILAALHIDEVIRIIRASENAQAARLALIEAFALTSEQAQAILDMRLRRLTSLEVIALQKEHAEVTALIAELRGIVEDEKKLVNLLVKELREIKAKYPEARRTQLAQTLDVAEVALVEKPAAEPCYILFTEGSYLKRVDQRAAQRASGENMPPVATVLSCQTDDKLLLFTDGGNMVSLMAEAIPEGRLRDRGSTLGSLTTGLEKDETVVRILVQSQLAGDLLFFTQSGMVKRTEKEEYDTNRAKLAACGLKGEDRVFWVAQDAGNAIGLVSRAGMCIRFDGATVPAQGRTSTGVKCMAVMGEDRVLFASQGAADAQLFFVSDRGYGKRMGLTEIEMQNRNGKGQRVFPFDKAGTNGNYLAGVLEVQPEDRVLLAQEGGSTMEVPVTEVPVETKAGKGTPLVLVLFDDVVTNVQKALLHL
ncbi:DNA topoisomerase 4 subunit A [Eubacteriales bacterium OttesenSCG-928-M02]|nr:DNA topoisomerase 4 subunit A [Eubacteriales bacterium OttesenSCG-928-M02]